MTAVETERPGADLTSELPYDTYREAGGILSEPDYTETVDYLRHLSGNEQETVKALSLAPESDRLQYTGISRTLQSPITAEGEALYCFIHRYRRGPDTPQGTAVISKTGDKSDQAVVAETLLLTGQYDSYARVVTGNPHLFPWAGSLGDTAESRKQSILSMLGK